MDGWMVCNVFFNLLMKDECVSFHAHRIILLVSIMYFYLSDTTVLYNHIM